VNSGSRNQSLGRSRNPCIPELGFLVKQDVSAIAEMLTRALEKIGIAVPSHVMQQRALGKSWLAKWTTI